MSAGRIAWIDHAKGLAIILVVMGVAALGYGTPDGARNWMLGLAAWAMPFAVPAFSLLRASSCTARSSAPRLPILTARCCTSPISSASGSPSRPSC